MLLNRYVWIQSRLPRKTSRSHDSKKPWCNFQPARWGMEVCKINQRKSNPDRTHFAVLETIKTQSMQKKNPGHFFQNVFLSPNLPFLLVVECLAGPEGEYPTDPFTVSWLQNWPFEISIVHFKFWQSADREALKLWKGRSGMSATAADDFVRQHSGCMVKVVS